MGFTVFATEATDNKGGGDHYSNVRQFKCIAGWAPMKHWISMFKFKKKPSLPAGFHHLDIYE